MLHHGKSSADSGKAQLKAINPIAFLTIALLLTGAVVIALGWFSYNSYYNAGVKLKKNCSMYEHRSDIIHFDEVLTMSARLAAATGDIQWEERYLEYEPKLDAAINEAIAIAPEEYDRKMVAMTKTANIKLAEMEEQAFDLIRQGNAGEARTLLSSDEYENQKWIFAQGMIRFARDMAVYSQYHELCASIVYMNEVLSNSVRMAVATGDIQWEKRYRKYKSQLDATINEVVQQNPKLNPNDFDASTFAASSKLDEMENRVFDLIREGHANEAKLLVLSDEYKKQRQIYADGMEKIKFELHEAAVASLNLKQHNTYLHIGAVAFLIPLLLISWIVVLKLVHKWEVIITQNNQRLATQADELVGINKYLDKKVEERTAKLADSEMKFRSLFENSVDAIFLADSQTGLLIDCNKAAEVLLEKSSDEIIGQHQSTIHPPEKSEFYAEMFGKHANGIGFFIEAGEVITKTGKTRLVDISTTATDIGGKAVIQVVFRDVTMRKLAEEALLNRTHELKKRIKEMDCLYSASRILDTKDYSFNEKMNQIVEIIPSSWQHTSITCTAITIDGKLYHTENYNDSHWKQTKEITTDGEVVGKIEVCYLEEKDEQYEGPFLMEERRLINNIAEQIGMFLESEKAEKALRENEEQLIEILNSLHTGVFVIDPTTHKIVSANPNAILMTGATSEEIIGAECFNTICNKSDGNCPITDLDQQIENEEVVLLSKDGTEIPILKTVTKISLKGKEHLLESFIDISKLKEAEIALEESGRFVRSVIDSLHNAVFILDSETLEIKDCNAAAVEIYKFPKDELTGKLPDFLFPEPNDFEDYKKKLFKAISKKGIMKAYDVKMKRKGGEIFFAEHNTIPLLDKSGSRIGWVSTISDITERKILEADLSQGQKLQSIGQLASGIAHEINTPTQFVSDNTRFLQDSFNDLSRLVEKYRQLEKALIEGSDTNALLPEITDLSDEIDIEFLSEDIPKAIDQSLEGLGRVSKIVRAMKDFAHPEVNEKKPENLNNIIESTATVARNEWKYVSEMNLELDPDLPLVECKGSEIGQVLLNVIINAAHAIEDAIGDETGNLGEIKISTHKDDEWVTIRISDTGTGIPEESRDKVFDHFYTTKEVGKGTGQGLAICHSAITKNHQGSLSFETEMGKGTTFIIRLPFVEDLDNTESVSNEEATALC